MPRDLAATNISSTELNITWSEPLRSNGILKNYTVYYKLIKHDNNTPAHDAVWKNKQTLYRTVTLRNLGKLKMKFAFGATAALYHLKSTFKSIYHQKNVQV